MTGIFIAAIAVSIAAMLGAVVMAICTNRIS